METRFKIVDVTMPMVEVVDDANMVGIRLCFAHVFDNGNHILRLPGPTAMVIESEFQTKFASLVDQRLNVLRRRNDLLLLRTGWLELHGVPNLRRDLDVVTTLTPYGFRDEMNSHLGSAFSVEPILTQSAWFRPHNRDDVIGNMYITGAGTHPGAGVPGVVGAAKATAGVIADDFDGTLSKLSATAWPSNQ